MRNYVDWKGFWSEGVGSDTLEVNQPAVFSSGLSVLSGTVEFTTNVNPEVIHVSLSGSDTSGDGSLLNPYRSIYKAIQIASASYRSSPHPYLIDLGAGTFIEDNLPLTIPTAVGIRGKGHTMTRVTTRQTGSTIFEMGFQSFLYDMVVNGSSSFSNNGVSINISNPSSVVIDASFLVPRLSNVIFSNFNKGIIVTGVSGGAIIRGNMFNDCASAIQVTSQSIFLEVESSLFDYSVITGSAFVLDNGVGAPVFGDEPTVFIRNNMFRTCENVVYTQNADQTKGIHAALGNGVFLSCSQVININDSSLVTVRASRAYNTVNYELYQGYAGGKCSFIANVGNPDKIYVQPTGISNVKGITYSITDSDSLRFFGEHPEIVYRTSAALPVSGSSWKTIVESPGLFAIDVSTDVSGTFTTSRRPFYINKSGSVFITSFNDTIGIYSSGSIALLSQSSVRFLQPGTSTANYVEIKAPNTVSSSHTYKLPASLPVTTSYLSTDTAGNLVWSTGVGGEINTVSNLGNGFGLYSQKVGADFQFKSLIAGTGVTLTSSSLAVTMSLSASGEANTASNLGSSFGLFAQKVGVDLQFKNLVAGSGIQFSSSSTGITIATTGSGGDITSGSNLGTGTGVFASKNLGILEFKSLTAPSSSLGGDTEMSSSSTEIALKRKALSKTITVAEDWLTSTYQGNHFWTLTNSGGASNATIVSTGVDSTTSKAFGVVELTTGTNAAGRAALSLGLISWRLDNVLNSVAEWRCSVPTLSTATQEFTTAFGWLSTAAASAQTNGIYFLYNRAVYGDIWYAVTANGAVRTETSTGVAVTAGQFTKFRIETLDATQATFYINDVLVATITTNLPSGAGKVMGPGVIIAKTVGTTARTLDVDYVDIIANITNNGR